MGPHFTPFLPKRAAKTPHLVSRQCGSACLVPAPASLGVSGKKHEAFLEGSDSWLIIPETKLELLF